MGTRIKFEIPEKDKPFFVLPGDFKMYLRLTDLRGWRIVDAQDSEGVVRRGMFIPFLQNGIRVNAFGVVNMTLCASLPKNKDSFDYALRNGQKRIVYASVDAYHWREMCREGLAAGLLRERRSNVLGHVYNMDDNLARMEGSEHGRRRDDSQG